MNATAHKNFAVDVLKVISSEAYDEMNACQQAENTAIRAARSDWNDALMNNLDTDEKALALDKLLSC